jgi:hypothetical protein
LWERAWVKGDFSIRTPKKMNTEGTETTEDTEINAVNRPFSVLSVASVVSVPVFCHRLRGAASLTI